jgi:hypothetical protein
MERSELDSASTADLVKLASEQVRELVREEIRLAKAEMVHKAKRAGVGAGMLGAAAALALFALPAVLTAAGLALALVIPGWAAALVVFGAVMLVAGIAAIAGVSLLKRGQLAPQSAIRGVRADLNAVSMAFKERRHA